MNMSNEFIRVNTLGAGANGAMTENGAVSYNTFGSALLDQFGKAGTFRDRDINDVWHDQQVLWSEDPENALKFPFYLRMITRQSNIIGGEKTEDVQRGQGNRDESFKRLLWIACYHPDEFYRNLWILPIVGSWKDLWVLMCYEGAEKYLKYDKFFEVIAEGINDQNHKDLVKKYMPRIRSEKKCVTKWAVRSNEMAKRFANAAGWTYKQYRKFKATGKAHEFQRIICRGLYENINWNTIPGQALLRLVSGNFLNKHNLTQNYIDWLNTQPVAKFNGYAYELGMKANACGLTLAQKITIDKQFDGLIKTSTSKNGAINGNVLCAIDTSGSMGCRISEKSNLTAYDVCVSLGIYFSELNTGEFHNTIAMFDDTSKLMKLSGSFTDKWNKIKNSSTAWGSTNFQSLIDLIVRTKKNNPNIPLEDFPSTLLVVSDMQFNPGWNTNEKTNYEIAMEKLRSVFPDEFVDNFKIIWWYCSNGRTTDFPSTMENAGTYMFSGFDGAVISFLLGGDAVLPEAKERVMPTMEDIINAAFSQEVMLLIK